ncbi:MAG: GNAT family N-acetyltransferase [Alphaproteobacteria bacterium]
MEKPPWQLLTSERDDDRRRRKIALGLGQFNGHQGHPDDWRPLSVFAHGPGSFWRNGPLIGGLNGGTAWGWLYVSHLWIEQDYRGKGLGSALLAQGEEQGRRRGAAGSHLTTADFQARAFYEKQGYTLFGQLDGMPPGGTLFYMHKRF